MTAKEQCEKTYAKVRKKYPNVADEEEIKNLAIQIDKRNTLLKSFAYLVGGIVCGVIWIWLATNTDMETLYFLCMVMAGSGIIEFFRTLGKYFKVEQLYRPVLKVKHEGELTRDIIMKDGGRKLKKAEYQFQFIKTSLRDKEDETDVGLDNETLHTYYLYFNGDTLPIKVSRKVYMDAVIGAQYYVVVTPGEEVVAFYQTSNWTVSNELLSLMVNLNSVEDTHQSTSMTVEEVPKTKKMIPILSIVIMVLSYCSPVILGMPLAIVALVLAIVGFAKQKTKLSISSFVICILLFVLLLISIVAMVMGMV